MAPRKPRGKSPEAKAEERRQNEARRNPDKNRADHAGRQNVKAPKLSDLDGRELTQEDALALADAFQTESDRGAALLFGAFVESAVEWSIYRRMPDLGPSLRTKTFSGDKAPLSSFYAKIVLGRAMGIYGPQTEKLLTDLKGIRNKFAHVLLVLEFKTPEIAAACNALKIPGGLEPLPENDTPRRRYSLAANWAYSCLMTNAIGQTRSFNIDLP